MKKHFRKAILCVFVYSIFLIVAASYADVVSLDSTSQVFVATNSNILQNTSVPQNINELVATKIVKPDAWYKSSTGLWYYFENNWTTTRTGWFVDPMDEQTYYLNPTDGVMVVGWKKIDGDEYFFKDTKDDDATNAEFGLGFFVRLGKGIKTYGSLYKDCMTPDGKLVDKDGKLISVYSTIENLNFSLLSIT